MTIKVPENFSPYICVFKNEKQVAINAFSGEKSFDDAAAVVASIMNFFIVGCCELNNYNMREKEQLEAQFMERLDLTYSLLASEWKTFNGPDDESSDKE